MNHRILTTSLSAFFVATNFVFAQSTDENVEKKSVPVLKEIPIVKKLFSSDVAAKKFDGTVKLNTDGVATGKATITIDINGKKETREIDLGNATEIKIVTDDDKTAPKTKRVTYLGVAPEELPEELAAQLAVDPGSGLLVRSVVSDSPAATAGIQKNDVLVKLDDQVLTAPKQLQKLVATRKPGESVRVTYFRRGQQAELDVKLAEHDEAASLKWEQLFENFGGKTRTGGAPPVRTIDPLTFQKKIVIVDKEGNVLTKDDPNADHADAIKRLADEVERMRDQAAAAQQKAQEAIKHAENAAREAAEVARKEASSAVDRMHETVRKLQEELERRDTRRTEKVQ